MAAREEKEGRGPYVMEDPARNLASFCRALRQPIHLTWRPVLGAIVCLSLFVAAVLLCWRKPSAAVGPFEHETPFRTTTARLETGRTLHVATGPAGPDTIEIFWEINDTLPYNGSRFRTHTAAFTGEDQEALLQGMTFEVLASLNGRDFTKIATVDGPANGYWYEVATPGWLYHFKVAAINKADGRRRESRVTLGATGPNLFKEADFETFGLGDIVYAAQGGDPFNVMNVEAFSVVKGWRPYADGEKILTWDPQRAGKQVWFTGIPVPVSIHELYLQGGWVRGTGDAWYGRWFYDKAKERTSHFSYAIMSVRRTQAWTFGVQLLEVDADDSALRIIDGRPTGMMLQAWKIPRCTGYIAPFVTAFDRGEYDDHWLLEVVKAPPDASVAVEPNTMPGNG